MNQEKIWEKYSEMLSSALNVNLRRALMPKMIKAADELIDAISECLLRADGETIEAAAHACGLESVTYTGDSMFSIERDFTLGDPCVVPDPERADDWKHEFQGTIIAMDDDGYVTVEDQEGNQFFLEGTRLKEYDDG
jgi:hypothetical protein